MWNIKKAIMNYKEEKDEIKRLKAENRQLMKQITEQINENKRIKQDIQETNEDIRKICRRIEAELDKK